MFLSFFGVIDEYVLMYDNLKYVLLVVLSFRLEDATDGLLVLLK